MSEFDPYLNWLGIRDPRRPPNHYRMLGLELYEDDPDVIQNAADRHMAHVRTFQASKFSEYSQKILNELAQAKLCLLNAGKKADYDAKLRVELAPKVEALPPPPPPPPAPLPPKPMAPPMRATPVATVMLAEPEPAPQAAPGTSNGPLLAVIAAAALLLLVAGGGIAWWATRPTREVATNTETPEAVPVETPHVPEIVEPVKPPEKKQAEIKVATPEVTPKPEPEERPAGAEPFVKLAGRVSGLAWASGRLITSSGDLVHLWNAEDAAELAHFRGGQDRILGLSCAPSGKRALAGGADGSLRLWDLDSHRELARLDGHARDVLCIAWSADGKTAASAGRDGTVRAWRVDSGEELTRLAELRDTVEAVAVTRDGERIAAGTRDGQVLVWETTTGRELASLSHPENARARRAVHSLTFSRDGRNLAYALADGTTRVAEVEGRDELHRLEGHEGQVRSVTYYAGDRRLLSGGSDGTVRVWDARTGKELEKFAAKSPVVSLAVTADGTLAFAGGENGSVWKWELPSPPDFEEDPRPGMTRRPPGLVERLRGREDEGFSPRQAANEVRALAFSPDDRHLALAGPEEHVLVWPLVNLKGEEERSVAGEPLKLGPHPGGATSLAFLGNDELLTGGVDGTLRVWNLRSPAKPRAITSHTAPVQVLSSAQEGRLVLSADDDRQARLWAFPAGRSQVELSSAGRGDHWGLSEAGDRAVSAGFDRTVRWWNPADGHEVKRLAAKQWLASVALPSKGPLAVTGGSDGVVRVWNETQETLRLTGHTGPVWALAATIDGAQAVSGGHDKSVRVWDLASGREAAAFQGHPNRVSAVAVSHSGLYAVSGDRLGGVCLWSLPEVEKLEVNPDAVVPARERLAMPEKAAITASEQQVRNQYKADYAKRIPAEKAALATRMVERSANPQIDATLRFVLLSEAKEQASGAGDVQGTVGAIDTLAKGFEVDALELAADALTEAARTVKTPEQHGELIRESLKRADRALAEDRHDLALKFIGVATRTAVKLNSPLLVGYANSRDRLIKTYKNDFDRVKKQVDRLAEEPNDPEANLAVGKYCAFSVGDWSRGLPRLALSSDANLARAAARDLKQPEDSASLRDLGRQWASVAAEETKLPWKTTLQIRAYDRYREALGGATDEMRPFLEEQLADLLKQLAPRAAQWLSNMPEAEVVVSNGKFGKGGLLGYATPSGDRIRVRGQLSPNGISMFPPAEGASHVAYGAFRQFRTFQATVGITDTGALAKLETPIQFVVICDGEERWRSERIGARGQTQDCLIDVTGVEKLVLEVECPGDNTGCQAVWLEPRLWPFKLK